MLSLGARGFAIITFIAIMVLIIAIRPRILINQDTNDWKSFGLGPGKCCYNITVVAVVVALLSYLAAYLVGTGLSKMRGGGVAPPAPPAQVNPAYVAPAVEPQSDLTNATAIASDHDTWWAF